MTNAELLSFLFAETGGEAAELLTPWILQSRRFQSFIVANRAKIRKKLRTATTPESLHSLLLELDIARYFSADSHCVVEYEKFGHSKQRSPDLTVTYRTHTRFNLEATCVRIGEGQTDKLVRIVGDKLGQLIPEMLNLLVLSPGSGSLTPEQVSAAMMRLKQQAEQPDKELLSRLGFQDSKGFFKQFRWLNGIVLWRPHEQTQSSPTLAWINPQARYCLPVEVHALLRPNLPILEVEAQQNEFLH